MIIKIKSDPAELKNVRSKIDEFCKTNFTKIDIFKVKLSVDEALQNIIRYAYEMNKSKDVTIEFQKNSEGNFQILIKDFGKQVPIDSIKGRDLDDVKPGGLGVYFIKKSTKFCEYKHNDNGLGTTLTLIF